MRNLKFLFISFFLVLVSVSSTFAADETTYNILYDMNNDGKTDNPKPTSIDYHSTFKFRYYIGLDYLEGNYNPNDGIQINGTFFKNFKSIKQDKSSNSSSAIIVSNSDNPIYSDDAFSSLGVFSGKGGPLGVYGSDKPIKNEVIKIYKELNNFITYLDNNKSIPLYAIYNDVVGLKTKIGNINICNVPTSSDGPDYTTCIKDKITTYKKVSVIVPGTTVTVGNNGATVTAGNNGTTVTAGNNGATVTVGNNGTTVTAGDTVTSGTNTNTPKTYTGFTDLSLTKDYMDPSLNLDIVSYRGACSVGIDKKTLNTTAEVNTCAKKIAKKIVDANDAGLNRFITYNSKELNKRLTDSYNVRVKNRKMVPVKSLIPGLTGALSEYTTNKYEYFNDTENTVSLIRSDDLLREILKDEPNYSFFKMNIDIEKDEVIKAKEFKIKFDQLKKEANTNAKLTAIYEISKIDFRDDTLKNSFYTALLNNIIKTTTSDPKVEQKFVASINYDKVIPNKDVRGQKLKSYIKNSIKNKTSTELETLKGGLKENGVWFMKDTKGNWIPN